jgi:hypothetical protein
VEILRVQSTAPNGSRERIAVISPDALELQRARRKLEEFCRRRNALAGAGVAWQLVCNANDWFIHGPPAADGPLLRLSFADGRWLVYVPAGDAWRPYPPLPEASTVAAVIDELEQAPLHVHW